MGCIIKDKIVPRAVSWFTGAAIDLDEDYDEDDEDDYGSDEEDEDDGSADEDDEDEDDDDEDEDEDEDEDDDHVDTGKMAKNKGGASAGAAGGKAPDGQECKQQ